MGFSSQEYWSGLPYTPPGGLLDPGITPRSLLSAAWAGITPRSLLSAAWAGITPRSLLSAAFAGVFFTSSATWEVVLSFQQGPLSYVWYLNQECVPQAWDFIN